jgi:hypothetical protein
MARSPTVDCGSAPVNGNPAALPAARRAGLEFTEKLLTTNLTSMDTTERNASMPAGSPVVAAGWRAG